MYGTIMRARVKAGSKEAFEASMKAWDERRQAPGFHAAEIAWEDGDPDRVVVVVHFADKESYRANAESPEQNTEYEEMVSFFEGPPEWIDVNYAGYVGKPLP